MRRKKDEQAEMEAVQERLKKFVKKASQCKDHFDSERMARAKEGREGEPRGMSWGELGRRYRTM